MAKRKTIAIQLQPPSWRSALDVYLRAIVGKDKVNKELAKGELWRMAEAADLYNETINKKKGRKK